MAINGNLPPNNNVNSTTEYFNNYYDESFTTSPNINDAVIGYFQTVTGDVDAGKTLASTVIYTALTQGLDPMSLVDEFKKMSSGKRIEVKTPIPAETVNSSYSTYDDIVAHKNEYAVGQLFYLSITKTFYRSYSIQLQTNQPLAVETTFANPTFLLEEDFVLPDGQELINPVGIENPDTYIQKTYIDQTVQIEAVTGYSRETVSIGNGQYAYNYYYLTYTQERDELTPYLTMLLNQNRVNTSLLGISNSPTINKYIQRAILA